MTNKELIELIFREGCKIDISDLKLAEKVKIASLIEKYFPHIKGIRKHLINDQNNCFLIDIDNWLYRGSTVMDFGGTPYNLTYKEFYILLSLIRKDDVSLLDVYKALKKINNV